MELIQDKLINLSEEQLTAIGLGCELKERIVAISGEAGTGKTTIMKELYEKLTNEGLVVVLAAPTGKAAKRIREATGIPAMTLHRLLEYPYPGERDPKTGKAMDSRYPKRDSTNPIDADIVLVDEYAMVSHEVHRNLINALPRGGCIRAFGDLSQLPPVEEDARIARQDSPFKIILSKFKGIVLNQVFRQDEDSGILRNAHRVRQGMTPTKLEGFGIKITDRPIPTLEHCIYEASERSVEFTEIDNQIITPGNNGVTGSHQLNVMLQNLYTETNEPGLELPRHSWREKFAIKVHVNDKVVITENMYDLRSYYDRFVGGDPDARFIPPTDNMQVFNGETGIIREILTEDHARPYPNGQEIVHYEGSLVIDLGDRTVIVNSTMMDVSRKTGRLIEVDQRRSVDLAYALTTHKCQGSEYENIIYVLFRTHSYIVNRSNLYTAITRAKRAALVISDARTLQTAVRNVQSMREKQGTQKIKSTVK